MAFDNSQATRWRSWEVAGPGMYIDVDFGYPEAVDEVLAHARAVRDAPTLEAGEAMAASLIDRFGAAHPSAVACFTDDLKASLAHLRLPGTGSTCAPRT